ncbi:MAG: hypothetical protein A3H69_02085 [Candidatus Sungbacteria bacterium RIFCSPLOWO2_02_FULL_47_9]|uniref:HAD family hydrolase n=1 Tax=Candidatus Sungbacteria bacterium RIFCSPHIGHO2_01_FULL_47_32 TaxID=1802264 RepID=A0A1G2K4A0_9BACT|nr:MAG: HAD ATPase, P-type, family IC [Parcubacteria group bacterium GW2011_GWA2_47_10]OGZ94259.1 MAG: hypothetical protein A2633_05615 [Candidatus Sungbacteria bacterium RIFCSPHIGHO2_01_FULL_47_32]OGZ99728.1 MAG: hypothetical protein A3D57_02405 [Candidatus Sungbacteria bacterium RIFCSPHIGHO2_02_FULL_46_12]OHA05900.1 MAG: hypothetical protein A3A28_02745 [Candidatus Sungbacteria bacterium RIFCSPLOWO2_01_FULL_47_32]OHA08602.1 MAG: hypothetical protein A3H69_02085 [Candidatus Sungbacteria bacter
MKLLIPNSETIELKTLILDLNGTLTLQGRIIEGVGERLAKIREKGLRIFLLSGDTRGNAKEVADELNIELVKASTGEEKRTVALELDPTTCAAVGNGLIDAALFHVVKLSIAVMQAEGVHTKSLMEADIVVPSILNALDILIDENSLIATLRP